MCILKFVIFYFGEFIIFFLNLCCILLLYQVYIIQNFYVNVIIICRFQISSLKNWQKELEILYLQLRSWLRGLKIRNGLNYSIGLVFVVLLLIFDVYCLLVGRCVVSRLFVQWVNWCLDIIFYNESSDFSNLF